MQRKKFGVRKNEKRIRQFCLNKTLVNQIIFSYLFTQVPIEQRPFPDCQGFLK